MRLLDTQTNGAAVNGVQEITDHSEVPISHSNGDEQQSQNGQRRQRIVVVGLGMVAISFL